MLLRTAAFFVVALLASFAASAQDSLSPRRKVIIDTTIILGNKVTKRHIITRELVFSKGDSLTLEELQAKLSRSRENLLNTSLFNFVTITPFIIRDSTIAVVRIEVKERWYTWPFPIFEVVDRNFNSWWATRDFSRVNYGLYLTKENFRGRKESLSFKIRLGYSQQLGVGYNIPYLTKKQTSGLGMGVLYTRAREVAYTSINNRLIFYKDINKYIRQEITARISYSYRQKLYNIHLGEIRYNRARIDDTVVNLSAAYLPGESDFTEYFSLTYRFSRDFRDSRSYPLKGNYFEFEASKLGLGILRTEPDMLIFYSSYRKYFPVWKRTFASAGLKVKYSPNSFQPYYLQRGLGYRDYVRAYEYYVIDGQSYGLLKSTLKYQIIKPRVQHLKFLPFEKFNTFHYALYGGLFADFGYVQDRSGYGINNNPLANTMLFGAGVGIDYVTYYDAVLRLEYSFNRNFEKGLFLHFAAPF